MVYENAQNLNINCQNLSGKNLLASLYEVKMFQKIAIFKNVATTFLAVTNHSRQKVKGRTNCHLPKHFEVVLLWFRINGTLNQPKSSPIVPTS